MGVYMQYVFVDTLLAWGRAESHTDTAVSWLSSSTDNGAVGDR